MTQLAPIVLSFDGLRASALGAYGNAIIETTTFDRLAAAGVVYDWCHVATNDLRVLYHSLWRVVAPSLLVTDDGDVAKLASELELECLSREQSASEPAKLFSATEFAHLADFFCEQLGKQTIVGPIWMHSKALAGVWDSPTEVAQSLAEEDETLLSADVKPPEYELIDDDADRVFVDTCRYHAELIAIDAVLEGIVGWLAEHDAYQDRPLIICGTRGFGFGEHGVVGLKSTSLWSEHVHVPCIVVDRLTTTQRDSSLLWLADVFRTASQRISHKHLQWWSPDGSLFIRTAEWLLRRANDSNRLYVKPDDRWEANDIAALCADDLTELLKLASGETDVAL